jgi:hypothetical protein
MEKEGAVRNEELKELRNKALEVSEKYSPNLNELQRVVIDRNTTIYVKRGTDPDEARKRFIEKMQTRQYDIRYKNYDLGDEG